MNAVPPTIDPNIPLELSRKIAVQALRDERRFTAEIVATPDECAALAKRYAVTTVKHLKASVILRTAGPELFRFVCHLSAAIVQPCGVSLEPVTQTIEEDHDEMLTTSPALLTPIEEIDANDSGPTELIEGDMIDYGEIVAQITALLIDPFPRKDTAAPVEHIEHNHNPFAALQTLKTGATHSAPDKPANDEQ